jgi:photosystem II stability/assembly factor-like uncharacterized protein
VNRPDFPERSLGSKRMNTRLSLAKNSSIGVLALLVLCAASSASAQLWRSAGFAGGDVRALASDPRDPNVVYLGTTDGHIFGSHNAGVSWKLLGLAGKNSNAVVTALIIDPRDSSEIYASTWTRESAGEGGGVFVSRNSGATWRESGLGAHAVRALAQAPSDSNVLVAGALDGVFISRDAGLNWTRATPAGDEELRNFDSLAIDPRNPDVIYAGTFHLPWKTIDGGKHWIPVHDGMIDDSDVLSLAIDATNSERIFASACSGIYRSDAAGALWEKIAGIPYASRRTLVIRQDPARPAVLYAGTTEGLWKSSDAGASWARMSPANWIINAMILEPDRDSSQLNSTATSASRLLIGTEQQGVLASDDGGFHFQAANDGFYHRRVVSVAVDSQDPQRVAVVLANAPEAVLLSEDGGMNWAAMDSGLAPGSVRSIFYTPIGWLAALNAGGLARYNGARKTWRSSGIFLRSSATLQPPGAAEPSGIAIPVVNDFYVSRMGWLAATERGLFTSQDLGKTWVSLPFAPTDFPVQSVRSSQDGKTIRIVSSHGMVFSDDAGHSWSWHDLPFESGGALKLEWADESTLLAIAQTGVYISRDSGANWVKEQAGLPGARAQELLLRPGLWLASMESAGLYLSTNDGASWSPVKSRDENGSADEFPVLVAVGKAQTVLAGSASEGLFLLEFDYALNVATPKANENSIPGGH